MQTYALPLSCDPSLREGSCLYKRLLVRVASNFFKKLVQMDSFWTWDVCLISIAIVSSVYLSAGMCKISTACAGLLG